MAIVSKIWRKKSNSIFSGAFILAIFGLLSRLIGLLRDRILASKFGAGSELDVYFAAFRIPDFIYNILIIGVISASFIPIFSYYLNINKEKAEKFLNALLSFMFYLLIIICLLLVIFVPYIIKLVVPGFEGEKLKLTILLTRLMFLSPILFGLSSILGGVLQTFRYFLIFAFAPIFYNLGIIFGIVFLTKFFGVLGLAFGVILGAFFHLLIQVPCIYYAGFRPRLVLNIFHPGIFKLIKLGLPRIVGLAASQINLWVITAIASTFSVGSLAIFNLVSNIYYFPAGIFGISFALSAFPVLSENFAKNEKTKFISNLSSTLRQILFYTMPISIFFIILRAHIVRIVLGAGKFDWTATRLTAASLALLGFSIFALGLISLLVRAFYASYNTKTPTLISVFSVILNIVFSFSFVFILEKSQFIKNIFASLLRVSDLPDIRILGLALAYSLATILNFLLLLLFLRKMLGTIDGRKIFKSFLKILFSSVIAGFVIYLSLNLTAPFINTKTFIGVFLHALTASFFGIISFFITCIIISCEEFFIFKNTIILKISKIKTILNKLFLPEEIES